MDRNRSGDGSLHPRAARQAEVRVMATIAEIDEMKDKVPAGGGVVRDVRQ